MMKKTSRERLYAIRHVEKERYLYAKNRWDTLAKPIGGLGRLEKEIARIYAVKGSVKIDSCSLLVFCADNGVIEEGVSQAGAEVTKNVSDRFLSEQTVSTLMANEEKIRIYALDVGTKYETEISKQKTLCGTFNMTKRAAMDEGDFEAAFAAGYSLAEKACGNGAEILALGEMGIGNTTAAAAAGCALLHASPSDLTGRGAGLSDAGLGRKIQAVSRAVTINRPYKDGFDYESAAIV